MVIYLSHFCMPHSHYNDVTMSKIASQITSLTIVYSTVYSGPDQTKHQSSASLAFVRGIHRGPVNSPHKWPVTRKMFPFDDVIMWGMNKMVAVSLTTFSNAFPCKIYLEFWLQCQRCTFLENASALFKLMAWPQAGDKCSIKFELLEDWE